MGYKMDNISQPIPGNSGMAVLSITLGTLAVRDRIYNYLVNPQSQPQPTEQTNGNSDQSFTYRLKAANTLAILSLTGLAIVAVLYCIHSHRGSTRSQPQPPEHTNSNPYQLNNPNQSFTYKPMIDYSPRAANTITCLQPNSQLNSNTDKTNSIPKQINSPIPEHTNSNPYQLNNPNQVFTYKPMIDYSPRAANTITCLQPNSQLNSNTDKTNSIPKQINSPIQNFDYNPEIKYNPTAANTMTDCGE